MRPQQHLVMPGLSLLNLLSPRLLPSMLPGPESTPLLEPDSSRPLQCDGQLTCTTVATCLGGIVPKGEFRLLESTTSFHMQQPKSNGLQPTSNGLQPNSYIISHAILCCAHCCSALLDSQSQLSDTSSCIYQH